ncbi:hypothetical protein MTR67_032957 [Solanum verrucosum]|uniref:PGG domain-containing protein n=1 Tax=Solanum verrucosum TaxID=315347 RepID=A0AAF0ZHI4_SOLVR|nr:hypothetical protein MTR67_032952 [Solanum verrucosum]WMV39572.1 hypothetical protein MTR67_032957 [Solanum verrucosum]
MLGWKKSLAYIRAGSENDWTTAFHIAISEGHKSMIHELLFHCPDCWDMLNSNGQNAFHVAILLNDDDNEAVNALFKLRFCNSLVDEADNEGNTPLHLLAASGDNVPQMILDNPRAKKMTFNKQNRTPLDIASSRTSFRTWTTTKEKLVDDLRGINARLGQRCDFDVKRQTDNIRKIQEMRKDDDEAKAKKEKLEIEKIMKSTQMHVVVATLIMTVTFAAGFTLPGGLDSDDGMVILVKNAAFAAFVISDILAFTCSACAIIIYFFMADSEVVVFKETKVKVFLRN